MLDILLIALVFLVVVPAVIISKTVKSASVQGPIILWKSQKGLKLVDRISKSHPRFWKAFGDFGIVLGFGFLGALYVFRKHPWHRRILFSVLSSSFLLLSALRLGTSLSFDMILATVTFTGGLGVFAAYALAGYAFSIVMDHFAGATTVASIALILPGIDIPGSPIFIPWYGWFSLIIIIVAHEGAHGILARAVKSKLGSTGIASIGVIPIGAFVEPDEKQLMRKSRASRLRVFSAGSAANFVVGIIILLFLGLFGFSFTTPLLEQWYDHPEIASISDASMVNFSLEPGMKVVKVNGVETKLKMDMVEQASLARLQGNILLEADTGLLNVTLRELKWAGITVEDSFVEETPSEAIRVYKALGFYPGMEHWLSHPKIASIENSTALNDGMKPGASVLSVDGKPVNSRSELVRAINIAAEKATITMETDRGTEATVTIGQLYDLGLKAKDGFLPETPEYVLFLYFFIDFLALTYLLNVAVAVMNYLPMYPFDGGRMLEDLAAHLLGRNQERGKLSARVMTVLMLLVILVNISPYFL
jgi:membrane-associated protease RseP (regulator of RpoE activity)